MRKVRRIASAIFWCVLLVACAFPHPIFHQHDVEGVNLDFDFLVWRDDPMAYKGSKVQLAGEVLDYEMTDEGMLLFVHELPVVKHPFYGPKDPGKRKGQFEFTILYPGRIDPNALQQGNKFLVIGNVQGVKEVPVDTASKKFPHLVAHCLHIWKTGKRQISDFPYLGPDYYALEDVSYCTAHDPHETQKFPLKF
jgi:starvation-inducible outer membrane lipoprotein